MSQWIERKIWNDSNWLKHHSKMKIIDGIGRTFCAHEQWKGEETTLYKSIKIIFIINSSKKTMLYNCRKGYKKKNNKKTHQNGKHYNNFKQKSISWNIFIWGFVIKLLFSCQVMSDSFVIPMNCCLPATLSMEFPMQEYWSGLHFLLQGIFSTQGWNLYLLH